MDNIIISDPLAERAHDAIRAYTAGVAKQQKSRTEIIEAVVEYGKALLEGRKQHGSNDEFGKWIVANKLDRPKPFDDRRERNAAQRLAENIIDGRIPVNEFLACFNTRPDDILKWARKQPWFEKKTLIVKPAKQSIGKPKPRRKLDGINPLGRKRHQPLTKEQVDPEFKGTPTQWLDRYGHVQVMTAEQYATERFGAWASNIRALATEGKRMPDWPNVDHNWLRSPRARDLVKLTEALEYLRPKIAEAEALLARACSARRQPTDESLQSA